MSKTLKTILFGLAIFAAVAGGIFVVYYLRKPTTPSPKVASPTPKAVATPTPSPAPAEVFEVNPTKCVLNFTVAAALVPGLNCVSKELYKDVASNAAGAYILTAANKLAADFTLIPGDKYVYVINYKNSGTGAIDGKITDVLPAGLTYLDSDDGCTYADATRTITCTIQTVAANEESQAAIRFSVDTATTATSITNKATLTPTTGTASTCQITNPVKTPPPQSSAPSASPSPSPVAQLDCITKRVYEDNSSNTSGKYYLNNEITDTATLSDGQVVVFNVVIKNTGGAPVPDTKITDVLSSNLTFKDAESGCTYDSTNRTVTCSVGSLAANTETSRSFRATISVAGTTAVANTADVTSSNGQRDSCSVTVNAAGKIVQPPSPAPTALPEAGIFEVTAGTLGVGVLLLIAGAVGLLLL